MPRRSRSCPDRVSWVNWCCCFTCISTVAPRLDPFPSPQSWHRAGEISAPLLRHSLLPGHCRSLGLAGGQEGAGDDGGHHPRHLPFLPAVPSVSVPTFTSSNIFPSSAQFVPTVYPPCFAACLKPNNSKQNPSSVSCDVSSAPHC